MKAIEIEAGGRTLPLVFNMNSWGEIEEEIAPLQDVGGLLEGKKRVKTVLKLVRILANEGLKCAGHKADLTEEGLGRTLNPRTMGELSMSVMKAVTAGMQMEATEDETGKEVDVTLQEINKKKEPEG